MQHPPKLTGAQWWGYRRRHTSKVATRGISCTLVLIVLAVFCRLLCTCMIPSSWQEITRYHSREALTMLTKLCTATCLHQALQRCLNYKI